jgi:hypothetical protein
MALMTASSVHQQEIDSAVHRVESKFAQAVDHIRYNLGENWIGAPSIFFRVVVRDEASRRDLLLELSEKVSISLMNEAKTDENGLYAYFDFMSMSEQARIQDPAWA